MSRQLSAMLSLRAQVQCRKPGSKQRTHRRGTTAPSRATTDRASMGDPLCASKPAPSSTCWLCSKNIAVHEAEALSACQQSPAVTLSASGKTGSPAYHLGWSVQVRLQERSRVASLQPRSVQRCSRIALRPQAAASAGISEDPLDKCAAFTHTVIDLCDLLE